MLLVGVFFGKKYGYAEVHGGQTGDADPGRFDGENLGDPRVLVETVEFLAESRDKRHVDLVVEEAVYLQHVPGTDMAVAADTIF